jgi:hypothetical protein
MHLPGSALVVLAMKKGDSSGGNADIASAKAAKASVAEELARDFAVAAP